MIPILSHTRSASWGKPRASGDDPRLTFVDPEILLVNPARAGMIPATISPPNIRVSKPRASGDDPAHRQSHMADPQ